MPSWSELLEETTALGSPNDLMRRKYIKRLAKQSKRNVITYYSGWLQRPQAFGSHVMDADKNGFMTVIKDLDRSKGLDLLLHTPGGDVAATESIVDYLQQMFAGNVRAIVPQLAMSAGTMMACSCKEIVMGKQSSLGPVDPQINGIPAHGILEEFGRALRETQANPATIPVWQAIVAKYHPALIGECEKAIQWSDEMVRDWLRRNMFRDEKDPQALIDAIVVELTDHALTKSHSRHLSAARCKQLGLRVSMMEDEPAFQDAILSVHHANMLTFAATNALKIIENQNGRAYIQMIQPTLLPAGQLLIPSQAPAQLTEGKGDNEASIPGPANRR